MDVFKVETRRIFLVFAKLTLIISSVLVLVSANCPDPGTLKNGYFIASHVNRGYIDGTVIYFYCNVNYKLIGAKKIICSKGKWNGKTPICQSQGCPLPPPSFPYAHVTSNPVSNTKGSYVSYACDLGYTSHGRPTRLLCDKDAKTQGYKWSGNITCQKVTCGPPPGPTGGHGNVTVTSSGTTTYAHYRCFPGYILLDYRPGLVDDTFTTVCSNSGVWKNIPSCVKTCNSTDIEFDHGNVKSYYPRYMGTQTHNFFYTQDVEVTFTCTERYKLQGYPKRTCTRSGQWSGTNPRCVPSSCGSPGPIPNGQGMSNNSNSQPSHFPIWTVVTFSCNAGYKLEGPSQRQCQTNGQWTQRHNPTCQKSSVTCKPRHLNYGGYTPPKPSYKLNELIHAFCKDTYYLYGELKLKCSSLPGQKGVWIPTTCPMSEVCTSQCLTAEEYGEKCKKLGQHSKILKPGVIICEENDEETPTAAKRSDSELDKMTIVVATAGSTLGALVVLLTALVCFRRFNRSRRFRRYSFRSRRYSDDDRIAIIAAYTGDVHFILPSYDEAMSQVERSPPPFEAVVEETPNSNNQSATNTNNVSATQAANAGTATENTNSSEQVGASPESLNTRAQDPTIAEERPIHIVSNPLHDSSHDTESHAQSVTVQNDIVNEGGSNFSVNLADESIDNGDEESPPNQQPASLPSSSSEDDLSPSQTQPLLGNARRGVMV